LTALVGYLEKEGAVTLAEAAESIAVALVAGNCTCQ